MVSGCGGQVGRDIVRQLSREIGSNRVIATDLSPSKPEVVPECIYEQLDIRDFKKYEEIVKENKVTHIIHLAALISAIGEKNVELAYDVNVNGTYNAYNIARDNNCAIFVPTTIGCYGGPNY
jgi:nucleoside-diphosphate-sugar epimerase